MKTSPHELAALGAASGPVLTQAEIDTQAWLASVAAENAARDHVKGRAHIDAAFELLKTDAEAVRAAHWNGLPVGVRRVAVMAAGMPKERADDALNKFSALERGRINLAMQRFLQSAEIVVRCMQGGHIDAGNVH